MQVFRTFYGARNYSILVGRPPLYPLLANEGNWGGCKLITEFRLIAGSKDLFNSIHISNRTSENSYYACQYKNILKEEKIMYKTIEAYYENGKIIYKEAMPPLKKAKLLITIVEEEPRKIPKLSRFKGIFKKRLMG
ncbi:MAG: hypothetical protein E3K36_13000 [Candidatus Brocadia sp.]|nr:hypothetical protein [Candidatus Brocadia sp.]